MFNCLQGMNFSLALEKREVKMKDHQVLTFHMAALNPLLFDSMPLQHHQYFTGGVGFKEDKACQFQNEVCNNRWSFGEMHSFIHLEN